jgi:hypothetical protein
MFDDRGAGMIEPAGVSALAGVAPPVDHRLDDLISGSRPGGPSRLLYAVIVP